MCSLETSWEEEVESYNRAISGQELILDGQNHYIFSQTKMAPLCPPLLQYRL